MEAQEVQVERLYTTEPGDDGVTFRAALMLSGFIALLQLLGMGPIT